VSGMFEDEEPAVARQAAAQRPPRSRALVITIAVMIGLFLAMTGFSSFWTERLWFSSVGYQSVFSKLVTTRIGLFLAFGLLMAVIVAVNIVVAYRYRPIFRPASPEQVSLDRYRDAVTPIRLWLMLGVSVLIGVFAGVSGAGKWREYLLWRHGENFGKEDPYFHKDIGFYVFDLPWLHYLVDFGMAVAVVSILVAALVHYLFGGIRLQSQHDRFSGAAAAQLSVLLGFFVLLKAADYWLDRFDLLNDPGSLITGITYTDDHAVLPAKSILMYIALICAVLFFANVVRRTWMLPSVGLGLLVLSAILLGLIWPGIVQQFQVEPTQADKEAPYIKRNIDATRAAYDIEDANVEQYAATKPANGDRELAVKAINHTGIRLVDPQLVQQTFEQNQQVRGYYSVEKVLDVDRYTINNTERDLVLGVRELDQSGLPENSKNWANMHTVYTHGYGVIAAFGNQRPADNGEQVTGDDEPAWAERDIPPEGELSDLNGKGYEGRIYFGENSPEYSVVGKPEDGTDIELDLPGGEDGGNDQTTTYDGDAGIGLGSTFRKLLYAWKFGEPNLVLSGRVHGDSKILYDREPREMVEKVAPWLTVDADPFPAIVDGKVVWLLDGYTTTDQYPLSERDSYKDMTSDALETASEFRTLPTDEINYMRNAVKVVVDAYDGTVTLYAWDESDPMLKAWRAAFPGTVEDKDKIPPALLDHMRYPEDLFKVQRFQLAAYHVTDADDFYKGNDKWEVPEDPNNRTQQQPPYRLSVATPNGGDTPTFSLTSVFVPTKRSNLAAFISVDADASEADDYGTLRVLRVASTINGPNQIANKIGTDEAVKNRLLAFTSNNSQAALFGNLLTLPIEDHLLYVQPIYTQRTSGQGNFPVLRFIAVSFGDTVGVGVTLQEAIFNVLDMSDSTPPVTPPNGEPQPPGEPTGTLSQQVLKLLERADSQFRQADAALTEGDVAGYAEHTKNAERLVNQALEKATQAAEEPKAKTE
jgi:uncharacterized membrane protein (UPF0182 family)